MSVVVGNEILDVMSSPRLQLRDRNSRQVLMPAPRGPDGSLRSSARQTVQFPQPAGLVRSTRTRAANYYPTPGYYPMPRSQPQDRFPGSGSIFAPKSNRTRPEGENRRLLTTQVADNSGYSTSASLPLARVLSNSPPPVARMQDLTTDIINNVLFWGGIGIVGAIGIIIAAQVSGTVQQEVGPLFG